MNQMEPPPKALRQTLKFLDTISIWSGKLFAWLILPMVFSLVYEVVVRYFFLAPTIWANDVSFMLYGSHFMLGSAYALQRKSHIRTDFFYRLWPVRRQGWVDACLYFFLFFPGMGLFLWAGWDFAYGSLLQGERIVTSPWMPPVYPFKLTMPLATLLLLLQGISEFIKSLYAATRGKWLDAEVVKGYE